MPQVRQDIITGRWVIIATERGKRPESFAQVPAQQALAERPPGPPDDCPFCPGHEGMTPPELLAYDGPFREPDTPGWKVRVVPNKYPALTAEGNLEPRPTGIYQQFDGVGFHEVIIHSPDHWRSLGELDREQVALFLEACRERYLERGRDSRVKYMHLIENHGRSAGASIEHPHSQLFGLPLVPPVLEDELAGMRRWSAEHGGCPVCAMLVEEDRAGERSVCESDHFFAFAPFASRVPFETWVVPREHCAHFPELPDDALEDLAGLLSHTMGRLHRGLNDPPYNLMLHSAPSDGGLYPEFHWHIEVWPKLSLPAGFEWGTGIMVNTALPEESAAFLREASEGPDPLLA